MRITTRTPETSPVSPVRAHEVVTRKRRRSPGHLSLHHLCHQSPLLSNRGMGIWCGDPRERLIETRCDGDDGVTPVTAGDWSRSLLGRRRPEQDRLRRTRMALWARATPAPPRPTGPTRKRVTVALRNPGGTHPEARDRRRCTNPHRTARHAHYVLSTTGYQSRSSARFPSTRRSPARKVVVR